MEEDAWREIEAEQESSSLESEVTEASLSVPGGKKIPGSPKKAAAPSPLSSPSLSRSTSVPRSRGKRRLSDVSERKSSATSSDATEASSMVSITVTLQQKFKVKADESVHSLLPIIAQAFGLDAGDHDRLSIHIGAEPDDKAVASDSLTARQSAFRKLNPLKTLGEQMPSKKSNYFLYTARNAPRRVLEAPKPSLAEARRPRRMKSDNAIRDRGESLHQWLGKTEILVSSTDDMSKSPQRPKKKKSRRKDHRTLPSLSSSVGFTGNVAGEQLVPLSLSAPGSQLKDMRNFTFGHGMHPAAFVQAEEEADGEAEEVESTDPVFGVQLETILSREEESGSIPNVLQALLDHLTENCLSTEGVFRTSGSQEKMEALKRQVNHSTLPEEIPFDDYPPHVIADLVKEFFRELPRPVLPAILFERAVGTIALKDDVERRLEYFSAILQSVPEERRALLMALLAFVKEVEAKAEENKMSRKNLCIVFGPLIMRPQHSENISVVLSNVERVADVAEFLISHSSVIHQDDAEPLVTGVLSDVVKDADQHLGLRPGGIIHIFGTDGDNLKVEHEGKFGLMPKNTAFQPISLYQAEGNTNRNVVGIDLSKLDPPEESPASATLRGLISPRRLASSAEVKSSITTPLKIMRGASVAKVLRRKKDKDDDSTENADEEVEFDGAQ